jgi:hypothetical protein
LILVGAGWKQVFQQLFTSMQIYVADYQRELLHFAADTTTALANLDEIA